MYCGTLSSTNLTLRDPVKELRFVNQMCSSSIVLTNMGKASNLESIPLLLQAENSKQAPD